MISKFFLICRSNGIKIAIKKLLNFIRIRIASVVGSIYYKLLIKKNMQYGLNSVNREDKIIISMATYEKRFETITLCLKSLLFQTYKPDKILVWLDPGTLNKITQEMKELTKYGVEYFEADENIKSHKKYYYTMKKYPDSIIITVDDDMIYSPFLISSLYKMHKKNMNTVCARRVHKILWDNNQILPYKEWEQETAEKKASFRLIAIGVGGILYPPNCLNEIVFNLDIIKKNCIETDDIWLKFIEIISDVPVVYVPCILRHPIEIRESQIVALNKDNVGLGNNDICIDKLLKYFKLEYGDFVKRR